MASLPISRSNHEASESLFTGITIRHDTMPVSYTHLDVYKRQAIQIAKIRAVVLYIMQSFTQGVDYIKSVSYTHLDVYKRQI